MRKAFTFLAMFALLLLGGTAQAATYELKIQTAQGTSSLYYKVMDRMAKRIENLSNGEIKVELLAEGAVVKGFEILDAVDHGIVNGGQAWTHYWSGKHPAGVLFAAPTAGLGIGLDQASVMSWIWEGDGQKLLEEYYQKILKANVKPYLVMPMGPEPFGWFKQHYGSLEEIRKVKFRSPPGVPAETFKELGMPVVSMPGPDIIPAAQRGVIDAAEWISPADDLLLGFSEIWKHYYIQGMHQVISISDILINKDWYDALPPNLQTVIDESMRATVTDMINMNVSENSKALKSLVTEHGVVIEETPPEYIDEYMAAASKIIRKYAADPFFKKVLDSMQQWAQLTVPYQNRANGVYYRMGKTALDKGLITEYKK